MTTAKSTPHSPSVTVLEWGFTLVFTLECLLRLVCVRRPWRYASSFLGIVDLLAVLPTYFVFFAPELQALINLRLLRSLRIFRILKLIESAISPMTALPVATPNHSWLRWLPGVQTLRTYRLRWLPSDVMAGLVLTTMLVPVGIA
jgi:Ion transport protein